jgi:uncharacterized C2H2 Zn-finger protein
MAVQVIFPIHLPKHTGEYIFRCDVCGKGLALRGNYNIHMNMHK